MKKSKNRNTLLKEFLSQRESQPRVSMTAYSDNLTGEEEPLEKFSYRKNNTFIAEDEAKKLAESQAIDFLNFADDTQDKQISIETVKTKHGDAEAIFSGRYTPIIITPIDPVYKSRFKNAYLIELVTENNCYKNLRLRILQPNNNGEYAALDGFGIDLSTSNCDLYPIHETISRDHEFLKFIEQQRSAATNKIQSKESEK